MLHKKKGGAIKVQPISITRTRGGVSRGCKKNNSGRPVASVKNKRFKGIHNLVENIVKNRNNAIL